MTDITVLKGNTIELHYWFNDNSHTMNAIVFNKCEYEFLGIAKEISQKLRVCLKTNVNKKQASVAISDTNSLRIV